MAVPVYNQGTASVITGSKTVTGKGTLWASSIRPGDIFETQGLTSTVETVVSNTELTLLRKWPGVTAYDVFYEVRYIDENARTYEATKALLELLGNGTLQGLAAITGSSNTFPVFIGPAVFEALPISDFAKGLLAQNTGQSVREALGLKGYAGAGVRVLGKFSSVNELPAVGSTTIGDAYLVGSGTNPNLYVSDQIEWTNAGTISGAPGLDGMQIYPTRAAAIDAIGNLNPNVNHVINVNGEALEVRHRNTAGVDPLFPSGNRWGVIYSISKAAIAAVQTNLDAEATARTSKDTQLKNALALIAPAVVGVTYNAQTNTYTGAINQECLDLGITALNGECTVVFNTTNSGGANPSLTVGNTARAIKTADDNMVPAGSIVPGRAYRLIRNGSSFRILAGNVTSTELEAVRIGAVRKMIQVTDLSPNNEKNAANWNGGPALYYGRNIAIGNTPSQLGTGPQNFECFIDPMSNGLTRQVWFDLTTSRQFYRLATGSIGWVEVTRGSDLDTFRNGVNQSIADNDASVDAIVEDITEIQQLMPATIVQTGPSLPTRPPVALYPMCFWVTWDDPTLLMGPMDLRFSLDSPTEPNAPDPLTWNVYDARNGQGLALVVSSVEGQNPPITSIDYGLDHDPIDENPTWTAVGAAAPGAYVINGLAAGDHQFNIRYRNFVGGGLGSLAKSAKVSNADIAITYPTNALIAAQELQRWRNINAIPNHKGLKVNASGEFSPTHANERYRYALNDYFVKNQRISLRVKSFDSAVQNIAGIGLGLHSDASQQGSVMALIRATGARLVYFTFAGGMTDLVPEHLENWTGLPLTVDFSYINGRYVFTVGGRVIFDHTPAEGSLAKALGVGTPEVYTFVNNGSTPTNVRFDTLRMGHSA